jgi:lysophospholipase L1-like esterase
MRWAIIKCLKITVFALVFGVLFTHQTQAWSAIGVPEFQLSDVKVSNQGPCAGDSEYISVSGEGSITACVTGESVRVAHYTTTQGYTNYAISFPFDDIFYRLDVCFNVIGCVYSEQNDTFISRSFVYKNFFRNLSKTIQGGVVHYVPSTLNSFPLNGIGSLSMAGSAMTISKNGKWAVIEMQRYGFFRINTETFQMRRVIAPGFSYSNNQEPVAEMAISNDGETLLVVGWRLGVWVALINEACGDTLNEHMETIYTGAVTPCRFMNTNTNDYISYFSYANKPKFGLNDESISFNVNSNMGAARHVTLFSENKKNREKSQYVAIGDSFTSGEGETDDKFYIGGATNRCHVSNRSYPFTLSTKWNMSVFNAACSGATMETARGKNTKGNQIAQLEELESRSPKVTTVGIGGNDAGLMGKLKDCLGLDTCSWAQTPKDRRSTALEIKNLYPRLKDFYTSVKERTTNSVIAVGYPLIISEASECSSPIGTLLNQTERRFMNESLRYLNSIIQAAALESNIGYVNTEDVFRDGLLCSSFTSPLMNDLRLGSEFAPISALPTLKMIGAESFHPKPAGQDLMSSRVYQAYNVPSLVNCSSCGTSTSAPSPSSYWESSDIDPTPPRATVFLNKTTLKLGDTFEISLPALSFKPLSDVTIQRHSDVKNLGIFKAESDGSLKLTLPIVNVETGIHSVHAVGQSYSGNEIDVYDFIELYKEEEASATFTSPIASSGNISNKQNESSTSPSVPLTKSIPTGEYLPASEVLGDSRAIVSMPALANKSVIADNQTVGAKDKEATFNWVFVGIVISFIVFLAVISGLYLGNRTRYPSR